MQNRIYRWMASRPMWAKGLLGLLLIPLVPLVALAGIAFIPWALGYFMWSSVEETFNPTPPELY